MYIVKINVLFKYKEIFKQFKKGYTTFQCKIPKIVKKTSFSVFLCNRKKKVSKNNNKLLVFLMTARGLF